MDAERSNLDAARGRFLDRLIAELQHRLPSEQAESVARFASSYYRTVPLDEVEHRSLDSLYSATLSCWQFVRQRTTAHKIRVFNPDLEQYGWQSPHTVIEVLTEDRPFLVDSVRMVLGGRGLSIHSVINAVFRIERDQAGDLKRFWPSGDTSPLEPGGAPAPQEAVLYLEIDRISDAEPLAGVAAALRSTLNDCAAVVADFGAMRAAALELAVAVDGDDEQHQEAKRLVEWLCDDHFTFLGYDELQVASSESGLKLTPVSKASLGLLRGRELHDLAATLPSDSRLAGFLQEPEPIGFAIAGNRSSVHRPAFPDYVLVRVRDTEGRLVRLHRLLGLYGSNVYLENPYSIPWIRTKLQRILADSGFSPSGHNRSRLSHILAVYPRDELFEIPIAELSSQSRGIFDIQERRKTKLFLREDVTGHFYSCLLFLPRELFSTELRLKIQQFLGQQMEAELAEFNTFYSDSVLVRLHLLMKKRHPPAASIDISDLERGIIDLTRTWEEDLARVLVEYFGEEQGTRLKHRYQGAFPAAYRDDFDPSTAVVDVQKIQQLHNPNDLAMSFYRAIEEDQDVLRFKLFTLGQMIPLCTVIPVLEHLGVQVIGERPYELKGINGKVVWIHDFILIYRFADGIQLQEVRQLFQDAFSAVWFGHAESDRLNRLVLSAGIGWREIVMLRTYAKYLKQIGFAFGLDFLADVLYRHGSITSQLVAHFKARFDVSLSVSMEARQAQVERSRAAVVDQLQSVSNLNEDRILRSYLELIDATLRTNFFQPDSSGAAKAYVSVKLDPLAVPNLPEPRPRFEIFVYAPDFEGVHLRAGKIARGGLRWSDRIEDFRTEVLGLVKAQQVKNSVIVPVGAKGGFVTKNLSADADRATRARVGQACYRKFIRGMLDLTDNQSGEGVVPAPDVVRWDEDDFYLVVAADKGTATFSDIANGVAAEYGFWLGDAFASGGETGYDHKKMGITARGAWVSVQRHFQQLGVDVQRESVTVVGIGDMSGDVFGNGMLLSKHIRLVAAFNHKHIFIDPNPDAATSHRERARLFEAASGWEGYATELLSRGGGIFSRDTKSIPISDEMRERFDIRAATRTPNELIQALLRAPVDLLWNGGIGTYVKASWESDADVGDKSNDPVRVDGKDLRCRVVGEGGNLGLTQPARIEYALAGGACNADFIDNSAGVDCSDHEVNLKIMLDEVVRAGDLTDKHRNLLLAQMTEAVAKLVLDENHRQARAIGIAQAQARGRNGEYLRYIQHLESRRALNPGLENLPDEQVMQSRAASEQGLTRPELAILLSYTKNLLKEALAQSNLHEDPGLQDEVRRAFPRQLNDRFGDRLPSHRLYRQIFATQVANHVVDFGGTTFMFRLAESTGLSLVEIVKGYLVVRDVFGLEQWFSEIDELTMRIDPALRWNLMADLARTTRHATRWLLRDQMTGVAVSESVAEYQQAAETLLVGFHEMLAPDQKALWAERNTELVDAGVQPDLAGALAAVPLWHLVFGIQQAASATQRDLCEVARFYFEVGARLGIDAFFAQVRGLNVRDHWQARARESFMDDIDAQQRALTIGLLQESGGGEFPADVLNRWMEDHVQSVGRWRAMLEEIEATAEVDLSMFTVAVRQLLELGAAVSS